MSGLLSKKGNRPHGFTLVELLVAISIVAILGAMVLGVAATATGTAREAKTKATVSRLHSLLMERYDLYRTRRVEIRPYVDSTAYRGFLQTFSGIAYPANLGAVGADARINAITRIAATREMMRVEMPDRWSDIYGHDLPASPAPITTRRITPSATAQSYHFLDGDPALWSAYVRAFNRIAPNQPNPHINTVTGAANTRDDLLTNQGAECLYLIVMNATGDGEAPGLFQESDAGDTDGDGALEFLDGWGNPISYLRWAPGYESDAQLSVPGLQQTYRRPPRDESGVRPQGNVAVLDAILEDHDPYDLFRLDVPAIGSFNATTDDSRVRGWRLVPLIVSAGPDEELGLRLQPEFIAAANPYADASTDADIQRLGETLDPDATADNIHNHQLGSLVRTQ